MDLSAIELNGAYDGTINIHIYIIYSVFDGWVMSLVWIAATQFVKS